MSTADSVLMGPVAIFTNDIYRKYLRPDASERSLVLVARIATIVLGVLGIGMAYLVPNVLDLILYAYTFGAAGLFFPDAGAFVLARHDGERRVLEHARGGGAAVIWSLLGEPYGFAASYTGWIIGLPTLIIVSLLTDHSPDEDRQLFYSPSNSASAAQQNAAGAEHPGPVPLASKDVWRYIIEALVDCASTLLGFSRFRSKKS